MPCLTAYRRLLLSRLAAKSDTAYTRPVGRGQLSTLSRRKQRLVCQNIGSNGGDKSDSGSGGKGADYGRLEFDQSGGGDSRIQDALVDMLGLQVGRKHVEEFTEQEKEKLINAAEEFKDEVDRVAAEQQAQSDEQFQAAMENIDKSAEEFEEQLRQSREQMQADQKDFIAWQRRMNVERSAGQFFKTLYQGDQGGSTDDDVQLLLGEDRETLKARAAEVQQSINKELGSSRRTFIFGFLSMVLALVCIVDAASDSPSWPQIGLYTGLASVFGIIALAEKRMLSRMQQEQHQEQEGGGDSGSGPGLL